MPKKLALAAKKANKEFSSRKFGVEIECVGLTIPEAQKLLRNNGISVYASNDTGQRSYQKWKVKADGSINAPRVYESVVCFSCRGRGQYPSVGYSHNHPCYYCQGTGQRQEQIVKGCEIVSPILSGEDGLTEIKKVCDLLVSKGVTANSSCGLHVHVNAKGIAEEKLINVFDRYCKFEKQIDKFVTPARRGDKNNYCFSPNGDGAEIDITLDFHLGNMKEQIQNLYDVFIKNQAKTLEDKKLKKQILSNYFTMDRHCKINLAAFKRTSTVEFRQHHGSVDAKEIADWVKFCVQFFEQSIKPQKKIGIDSVFAGINDSVKNVMKKRFPVKKKIVAKTKSKTLRRAA